MDSIEAIEILDTSGISEALTEVSKTSQDIAMTVKDRQKEDEKIPKSMKQRYWHSWEELRLVELWRRYKNEVTDLHKCLPVYRKIVCGMKSFGFVVNTQDCRRKINTLTNRYMSEKRHMEISGNKPIWRLYPLINCIIDTRSKWEVDDPWHENRIIQKLLDKIEPLPVPASDNRNMLQQLPPRIPLQIRSINANGITLILLERLFFRLNNFLILMYQEANNASTMERSISPHQSTAQFQLSCEKRSRIIPINRITEENLKQLRAENNRLTMERDEDLKRLRREEEGFHKFQSEIQHWNKHHEDLLQKILNRVNDVTPSSEKGKA
uniref:Myb/SANT-like DNA-binding domain-containing protein n=1 Tax=Glossina brevipalpis TaxID=37001 RepID=A0A1A9WX86_9MUSC